jgi:succinate dehydrogenase / fumarate reductase cytochrome b subunit
MLGEIALVFAVFYHGVNGARIALFDLFMTRQWNIPSARKTAIWTLVIAIILWLPAAFLMGRALLRYNFGVGV